MNIDLRTLLAALDVAASAMKALDPDGNRLRQDFVHVRLAPNGAVCIYADARGIWFGDEPLTHAKIVHRASATLEGLRDEARQEE